MITSRGYFTGFITPPVRRDQLEVPSYASLYYFNSIDNTIVRGTASRYAVLDKTERTDGRIQGCVIATNIGAHGEKLFLRWVDEGTQYASSLHTTPSAGDHYIYKVVAGTGTKIATEAVDLTTNESWWMTFSISGSTLKSWRQIVPDVSVAPTLSVTDTSISSGLFGYLPVYTGAVRIDPPASPAPKTIAYFEIPIIGSGTPEDPFRAQLPEMIDIDWSMNPQLKRKYNILKAKGFTDEEIFELFPEFNSVRVNRLALTNSALIKTGADGKPVEYRAIVRIFDQPDRSPSLAPISQVLDALKNMSGVRQLTREQAIKEAKRLDDKLHDLDLLSARELGKDRKQAGKDYVSWRIHNLGVREELLDISTQERYAEEDKGW